MMSLVLRDFKVGYEGRSAPVLSIPAIEFQSGINLVIGRNGSGKSTLLRGLTGHYQGVFRTGTALLKGKPLAFSRVGMVTQRPTDSIVTDLSFFENVLLASSARLDFFKLAPTGTAGNYEQVAAWLDKLGLAEYAGGLLNTLAARLSGGQQQLLAIIMRLLREPQLLLLDEITANLDSENSSIVLGAVQKVAYSGSIVLLATHQLDLCENLQANVYEVVNGYVARKEERM